MITINLLPWREELRQKKQRNLKNSIIIGLFFLCLLAISFHMFLLKEINAQKNKNQILTLKLKQCEQKKKGFEIEKQGQIKTENVLQMLNVLIKEQVQNAKMLSELSAIIPDAITLTNINKNGNEIIIIGNSIAMQNIADLLKNSTNNNFFKNPDLAEIKNSGKNEHLFVIKLELK